MHRAVVAIPVWILTAIPAFADCIATPVNYYFRGDRVNSSLQVQGDSVCLLQRHSGVRSTFSSTVVSSQPSHGSARIADGRSIEYIPQPGFRGKDAFTQKICGGRTGTGCSFVAYTVTVD